MTPEEQAVLAAHDAERRRALEERDAALARIDQVRAVHVTHRCSGFPNCAPVFGGACMFEGDCEQCRTPFPCATVRILDGEAQS